MAKPAQPQSQSQQVSGASRFIVMHGDKGGVGKSMVAQALADYLMNSGEKVAVIEADTRNPDVGRMFNNVLPVAQTNIRSETGWMDVVDFVMKHLGHTIIMNTPAGIGEYMTNDIGSFVNFLKGQDVSIETELWWLMNIQHDSVNLLGEAYKSYGDCFSRIRVCCNLHFAGGGALPQNSFELWNESPLKTGIENKNGMTLYFPALHIRVVKKVLDATKIMPYSDAMDVVAGEALKLETSERWKLATWIKECANVFAPAFK